MRHQYLQGGFALVVGLLLGSACGPQAGGPMRMMAKERPYYADVPVPMGFKFLAEASEDSMTGRRRLYARHVYEGRADLFSVLNFYKDRMPQYNWQMVNAVNVKGVHTLQFEKGQESCSMEIRNAKSKWGGSKVRVQMIIMQEERGTASNRAGAS